MTFYMTLSSNASMKEYPNNTISDFRVRLPEMLRVPRENYTIGLVQISYINSISLLAIGPTDETAIRLYLSKNPQNVADIYIPPKTYQSIEVFVEVLNAVINTSASGLKKLSSPSQVKYITYDKTANRISINAYDLTFSFPALLNAILGFSQSESFDKEHVGDLTPDMYAGCRNAYVYCSLVETTIVSDIKAPLLREFPLQLAGEKINDSVSRIFTSPFYLRPRISDFDSVHIKICDESGDTIPFLKGPVTLTLEFKFL